MLNIYFGDREDAIYNTSMYFNNTYLDKWLEDELSKKIIKNIDKGDVISANLIITKALGPITPKELSGGTKTLLLMRNDPEKICNASTCGDNCARWILAIAKELKTDLTINLYHLMDFGERKFEARILNNNVVVHNMKELVENASEFI